MLVFCLLHFGTFFVPHCLVFVVRLVIESCITIVCVYFTAKKSIYCVGLLAMN